jgi:hypothetical protein
VNRHGGVIVLVFLAALAIVAVVGVQRPIRVEPAPPSETITKAPESTDAGSLDSLLDAIQIDHLLRHGR